MEHTRAHMKALVLFTLSIHLISVLADTHTLQYTYTAVIPGINLPEFTVVGLLDEEQFLYYDSNIRQCTPKTEWIKKVKADDPDYWHRETQKLQANEETFKANVATTMWRFNQSKGVHTLQCMYSCELDDDGTLRGYDQYSYDGEDFLSLDLNTLTWIAANEKAFITKMRWEATMIEAYEKRFYLENICMKWLQKYVEYNRILRRKVVPEVSLFQKNSSSPVVCHATGFYPREVIISWQKNGEDLNEDVESKETLPNHDGTFQKRSNLRVSSEDLDKNEYICVVQHSGVQNYIGVPVIHHRGGDWMSWLRLGTAAAFLLLLIGCFGFFIWKDIKAGFHLVYDFIMKSSSDEDYEDNTDANNYILKEDKTNLLQESILQKFLQDLGLHEYYQYKLSLSTVLEIDNRTVTDDQAQSLSDLPWTFLKKLMMVNVTARSISFAILDKECADWEDYQEDNLKDNNEENILVNPLDLVNALFLCADGFLQQEMVSKMSACQFSVPLLLTNCETNQTTFQLWAMRGIMKIYRPHSLQDESGFVEERIVISDLPLVSFVRLGDCHMSKSQILNKLLSNPQQYHDTFLHKDMNCGNIKRKISNGLVEISWYLPCRKKNIDIFPEPVAVANLRGDISSFETQYSFLIQTSDAVFVFFDKVEKLDFLKNQHAKAQLILVGNFETDDFKSKALQLDLKRNHFIFREKQNEDSFVKNLRAKMNAVIKNSHNTKSLEKMTEVAYELGIRVDEDTEECKNAKELADEITSKIHDIPQFKETHLPLQGKFWRDLASLDKEQCRLRKAGDQHVENYKCNLSEKMKKIRQEQYNFKMSKRVRCFIKALSKPCLERAYFLKWTRMNLDSLTSKNVSKLRDQYKKCKESSGNKEDITKVDKEISCCSLGIEHFLREISQLYECTILLTENAKPEKQIATLPHLCAELMLEGFPLELLDGDASSIPIRWISDVLTELNDLLLPNNKILVVTVLGVQSTGKSTLLNTMFGVQFAVSSGRCTRGAFMLLLKVTDEFKKVLSCDYVVIIDTEGLKSSELAQLDNSYEHDNELATFVVGLSDVTIINIAMENSSNMNDILQIVVHAFLRMNGVGKKPKCVFVHQNVGDVSAHDTNIRDRTRLLDQLNEMTELAAKMENSDQITKFTDVMEYDAQTSNWYIPGLWHGNPPMASVNVGYSDTVSEFKIRVINELAKSKANNLNEFLQWTKSLWSSVKFENFIFSFRNSLVADAYRKICVEFNKWNWSFRKHMHTWALKAEANISNFGKFHETTTLTDLRDFVTKLKTDACLELSVGETTILNNITRYFEQADAHVELVERFKEDFMNSGKSLRRELNNAVNNKLESAANVRQAMTKLENIRKKQRERIEKRVLILLVECRKHELKKSDTDLEQDFEKMWNETIAELSFQPLSKRNIMDCVSRQLRLNLQHKGSSVLEELDKLNLCNYGTGSFEITNENSLTKTLKKHTMMELQALSKKIITKSEQLIAEKITTKNDYDDTYIREVLQIVDEELIKYSKDSEKIEVNLKKHICGLAGKQFQNMHDSFIQENDFLKRLEQSRDLYYRDFKDLFSERDQCQRKAKEMANRCLMPAVETYLSKALGLEIVDEMLKDKGPMFSARTFFHQAVLKDLLDGSFYEKYLLYILSYESFVKNFVVKQLAKLLVDKNNIADLEDHLLTSIFKDIMRAILKAQEDTKNSNSIKDFIFAICKDLDQTLVISVDSLEELMSLSNADVEEFAKWLRTSVEEMKVSLQHKYKNETMGEKLNHLEFKPVNELLKRVIGCEEQCPFCGVPCEATGEGHTEHFATIHRPQGLISYHSSYTEKLVTDICTSSVVSEKQFISEKSNKKPHPYRAYHEIYPDWHISPDFTIEASDYWKYVMTQFNEKFADFYDAQPADIPPAWKQITKEQAESSLMKAYGGQ